MHDAAAVELKRNNELDVRGWWERLSELFQATGYAPAAPDEALRTSLSIASGTLLPDLTAPIDGVDTRPVRPLALGGGTGLCAQLRGSDAGGSGKQERCAAREAAAAGRSACGVEVEEETDDDFSGASSKKKQKTKKKGKMAKHKKK
jgi:hypothetical protein